MFALYWFAYHNDNCESDRKSIALDTITFQLARSANASQDDAICTNSSTVNLDAATNATTQTSTSAWTTSQPATLLTSTEHTTTEPTTSMTSSPSRATPTTTTTGVHTIQPNFSAHLQNAINKDTYPNNTSYYTQSTHHVLNIIQSAVNNESVELTFNDIFTIATYFQEFAGAEIPDDLPEGSQNDALNTLLQITDQIVIAEESGKSAVAATNDGYDAASIIYQALETLYNNLPPTDAPYVFNETLSFTFAHVLQINASSQFDDFKFHTKMDIVGFNRGILTSAGSNLSSVPVTSISFKDDVLREAFNELKQTASETNVKFAFSLSAMPAFKFARYIPASEVRQRSSPLVLLASVGHNSKRKDIITVRHNVDQLFNFPSGARRQHQCIFLDYTSKQWSTDGCRVTAKYPKWSDTVVECTCDHLTPFSLLLTLCGSLSNSFASKDKPFTLDLAIVTTMTTAVSTLCCLIALVIIVVKTWRREVVYDEKNFIRTGLWIALFGMYCFIISSKLMVYFPELCGQQFCLINAILVHWFALMSVAWTAVQTVRIIQIVRRPLEHGKRRSLPTDNYYGFNIKNWLAATLIPSIFPFLASMPEFSESLAPLLGGYGYASHEKWCWLGDDNTWIPWVTFIVPVSLVALLNVSAVILYVISTRKLQKDHCSTRQA
ncbi:uncharacterized protein LOC129581750 [Paramacrobiotus metropolitanus]|uniref:uncharacterized protein LOC129581750 n=1 Tax=Paramacrobiotus metropolitanus TaxID=2943436 RepID=UPI002445A957|nr:uncharacterized protein LOC129581750 [Paramacrobiotus metropolitanus]